MSERQTHRTYCRICVAVCGLEIDVEEGRAIAVRGDAQHPLSAGYTCTKGRALSELHHAPERLDHPLIRTGTDTDTDRPALTPTSWHDVFDDLDGRLADIVRVHGTDAVGFFNGSGIYSDAAGYWAMRRLSRKLDSAHFYSDTTIDSAAKYRVMELMAGTYSLMAHADPEARLVLMFGTNPVVSHGQTPMFEDPVQRIRRAKAHGEVWVVDPRTTESAKLATRHLAIRPGSDYALLAWLVRSLLESPSIDRAEVLRRCSHLDRLTDAVRPYDGATAAARTGLAESELNDLLAAVCRAGRLAVLTGTGVTMSPTGNSAEWLAWALLAITDSFDRPGGMWFNPGLVARLDTRASLPAADTRPGPPTRRDINTLMGEWPAALMAHEIEAGNLCALFVMSGNIVTAVPDTNRLLDALAKLDLLVVVDVVHNQTTELATHVLPAHAQLERPDVPMLNDLFNSKIMMQYTAAVLPQHEHRRSAWWIVARIGRSLGVDVLPEKLDFDTAGDDDVLAVVAGTDAISALRAADPPWVERPSPVFGWVDGRLPTGSWNLAPEPLVSQLALLESPPPRSPGSLLLMPRRQPRRFNGRSIREGDRPEVLVHPDDAADLGVTDGEVVEVTSECGSLAVQARVTSATRVGTASIAHGWAACNVNLLISSTRLDPLTGMPQMSGTEVWLRPLADQGRTRPA